MLILSLLSLVLAACSPLNVSHTIRCDKESHICTVTVTSNVRRKAGFGLKIGYESQGVAIKPYYDPVFKNKKIFKYWERDVTNFFSTDGYLEPGQTQTFTATMPQEFFKTPGQSLVDAYLEVDPPNGFSMAYGRYHRYATVDIVGYYDRPIKYAIACADGKVKITITNTGEWGDRNIALYLNGSLDQVWQLLTVKDGDTQTFTTDPLPSGTYLVEADVHGHQEQVTWDKLDYHGSRAYCVPPE